jgi:tetratricopeptide (TPR) repeat protein
MLKKSYDMTKILTIFSLAILSSFQLFGQINDSTKVEHIIYDPELKADKYSMVKEQQLKAKPYYDKAFSLVDNHRFDESIKSLNKAIEIDSTGNCGTGKDGLAQSELGYAYTRLGDYKNARIYLDKAIQLNSLLPEPYLNLSVMLMQQGNNELAIEILNKAIINIPDYAMAYVQRGFLYDSLKDYGSALKDFHRYLDIVRKQGQLDNSKSLVEAINKRIKELETKNK